MSTGHVFNFFQSIRGIQKLNAPVEDAVLSHALVHYANIAYRSGKGFRVDPLTGKIADRKAARFYGREYAPGWNPKKYL
jgi:hypothetical protein